MLFSIDFYFLSSREEGQLANAKNESNQRATCPFGGNMEPFKSVTLPHRESNTTKHPKGVQNLEDNMTTVFTTSLPKLSRKPY